MPELPDITLYVEALSRFTHGKVIEGFRNPSLPLVKTIDPPIETLIGAQITGYRSLGKRIVFELDAPDERDSVFAVLHLMIAGRLRWKKRGIAVPRKGGLAAFDFADGTLLLTEQGRMRRASLHLVRGEEALQTHDRHGLDPLTANPKAIDAALRATARTIKRALCDPRVLSGIGNAYSDEILHRARISPLLRTPTMSDEEMTRLIVAMRETLTWWTIHLRTELGDKFPDKVTAFRPEMAVHGKYREPCPDCASPVQRIRYAKNETNYCATCQTDGRVYADRSLSTLLRGEWPKTLDGWEDLHRDRGEP